MSPWVETPPPGLQQGEPGPREPTCRVGDDLAVQLDRRAGWVLVSRTLTPARKVLAPASQDGGDPRQRCSFRNGFRPSTQLTGPSLPKEQRFRRERQRVPRRPRGLCGTHPQTRGPEPELSEPSRGLGVGDALGFRRGLRALNAI